MSGAASPLVQPGGASPVWSQWRAHRLVDDPTPLHPRTQSGALRPLLWTVVVGGCSGTKKSQLELGVVSAPQTPGAGQPGKGEGRWEGAFRKGSLQLGFRWGAGGQEKGAGQRSGWGGNRSKDRGSCGQARRPVESTRGAGGF